MIYAAFTDHFSSILPIVGKANVWDVEEASRRIRPTPVHTLVGSNLDVRAVSNKGLTEMVSGLIPLADMSLFVKDRSGLSNVKQHLLKLIDNFYQYSLASLKERKFLAGLSKIVTRRRMVGLLRPVMPDYIKRLEEQEKQFLKKHQLENIDVEKEFLYSTSDYKKK